MSSRVSAVIVVFKEDVSEEYFDRITQAFHLYDGVLEVTPYVAGDDIVSEITATTRERNNWIKRLLNLVKEAK